MAQTNPNAGAVLALALAQRARGTPATAQPVATLTPANALQAGLDNAIRAAHNQEALGATATAVAATPVVELLMRVDGVEEVIWSNVD